MDTEYQIRSYGPGAVRINDTEYAASLVVTPYEIFPHWAPQHADDINDQHWSLIDHLELEIILVGTGKSQRFYHPQILRPLHDRNIGVEIMDTGAACRTYNILLGEGRNVAAALIMI